LIEGKSVLAVIPARGGSKGIRDKNIVPVAGKPLIQWTIEAANLSQYIDRLVLSTDDPRIKDLATARGCEDCLDRPPELATDDAKTVDVVFDVLSRVEEFDLVMVLQPTCPLRTTEDIDKCLERLMELAAPAAVSVKVANDHPFLMYSLNLDSRLESLVALPAQASLRRQDLPAAYVLNGAVYVARVGWLSDKGSFAAQGAIGYVMPEERSVDIDTQDEIMIATKYLQDCGY
tara:strand:- start:114 stop:809 length:696 start_codon:yes stop_codon:yes gene_type:complete